MTSIYSCNGAGNGARATPYRPDVAVGTAYACLMIHEAKLRALIISPSDTLSGTGITKLITGTTLADLRNKARTANPTATQRTSMDAWLITNGYTALPASAVSWWDCIHHIARQHNPAADLDLTGVA